MLIFQVTNERLHHHRIESLMNLYTTLWLLLLVLALAFEAAGLGGNICLWIAVFASATSFRL